METLQVAHLTFNISFIIIILMEESNELYKEPKYTMRWLGIQSFFILAVSLVLALVAGTIDSFASGRVDSGLLTQSRYAYLSGTIPYCFAVIAISLLSISLIEIAFRKSINYIQYALIGCALCLFNMILLAMAEQMPFLVAYIIVSAMTIGLIVWFVKGLTQNNKPTMLAAAILAVEYALLLLLVYMGSMALLVGSLVLFILIGVAMYFTLKLKVENEELVIK